MSGLNGAEFALLIMSSIGILLGIVAGFILLFRYINTRRQQVQSQTGEVSKVLSRMESVIDAKSTLDLDRMEAARKLLESSSESLQSSSRLLQKIVKDFEKLKARHGTTQ